MMVSSPKFAMIFDSLSSLQLRQPLLLSTNEVHVWYVSLDRSPKSLPRLESLLSPDEQIRVRRFHFDKDRNNFIVSHGLLRVVLGGYLGIEPSQVQLCYGPYGKPSIETLYQGRMLQFSLSHSKDLALFAVNWDRLIGIDVEHIRPVPEANCIAEQFFSPNESAMMRSLLLEQRQDAFFRIWTCKEAYLKASGYGITGSLTETEVSVSPEEPVRLVSVHGSQRDASLWQLEILSPSPDYLAALAVQGHEWYIKFLQLIDEDPYISTK